MCYRLINGNICTCQVFKSSRWSSDKSVIHQEQRIWTCHFSKAFGKLKSCWRRRAKNFSYEKMLKGQFKKLWIAAGFFPNQDLSNHTIPLSASRRSHPKRYSVIAITLRYVFALLHNALYLWRIVIAFDSYRFRLFAGVIASDSYCSELAGQRYRFTSLSLWVTYASDIATRKVTVLFWR
jgi:hypothetical protein